MSVHFDFVRPVQASEDALYEVLKKKVLEPELFVDGIKQGSMSFSEPSKDGSRLRTMERHGILVKESIDTNDESKKTLFKLVDHPMYDGTIASWVESSNGTTMLHYTLDWEPHGAEKKEIEWFRSWFPQAVSKTVEAAEAEK
jgi:hypothetical protein